MTSTSARQHSTREGIRIVWRGDLPEIRGRHLHPADVGGAIVSIDQPVPNGAWKWGGPDWVAHQETSVVTAIAGVVIGAKDPVCDRASGGGLPGWSTPSPSSRQARAARASTSWNSWPPTAAERATSCRICGITIRLV